MLQVRAHNLSADQVHQSGVMQRIYVACTDN